MGINKNHEYNSNVSDHLGYHHCLFMCMTGVTIQVGYSTTDLIVWSLCHFLLRGELTGCRFQRCCSGSAASRAWWCWAGCTTRWGSLLEHTEGDMTTWYLYSSTPAFTYSDKCKDQIRKKKRLVTNLFHPIIVKDIHVISRSTCEPVETQRNVQTQVDFVWILIRGRILYLTLWNKVISQGIIQGS